MHTVPVGGGPRAKPFGLVSQPYVCMSPRPPFHLLFCNLRIVFPFPHAMHASSPDRFRNSSPSAWHDALFSFLIPHRTWYEAQPRTPHVHAPRSNLH